MKSLKRLSRLNVQFLKLCDERLDLQCMIDGLRDSGLDTRNVYRKHLRDQLANRNYYISQTLKEKDEIKKTL